MMITQPKVARLTESEKVSFGPDAFYHALLGDGDTPIFLGIRNCPGRSGPIKRRGDERSGFRDFP